MEEKRYFIQAWDSHNEEWILYMEVSGETIASKLQGFREKFPGVEFRVVEVETKETWLKNYDE